ncbi:hypothetical protein G7Y89_g12044 [Cudoniella acicularis]|uniref:Mannan endo-1,6-alpha-mannosidase n=1 Tax=Cudoniella acicularis TaxID=354080 RepID=A0A8H4VXB3_9HELO|nr:hypothetical protein G7Y89_g12044 [Cudoniella acicularis]
MSSEIQSSIKAAASTLATGLISNYNGYLPGNTPGLLSSPYYWWEAGVMFDTLIQYFHLTGDSQYNGMVSEALQFQQGPNADFMPSNQTKTEGNDDQGIWALAAMSAAEAQLPGPPGKTWVALAEAVFNEQVARWDYGTCGGGLRWQIYTFNTGYTYKNSISSGLFFQLASRLARYTGNSTYSDWATTSFNWTTSSGLIDTEWNVFDGADVSTNCSAINHLQWSYVAGTFITGAAHMYNITTGSTQATWKSSLDGLLNTTLSVFFPSGIATEILCESIAACTVDEKGLKGMLGRWLADTIQMAPYTSSLIAPKLQSSAQAAAKACTGTGDGCSFVWSGSNSATGNATGGVGEQLDALSYVQGLLVGSASVPITSSTASGSNSSSSSTTTSGTASSSTVPVHSAAAAINMDSESLGVGLFAGFLLVEMAWLLL